MPGRAAPKLRIATAAALAAFSLLAAGCGGGGGSTAAGADSPPAKAGASKEFVKPGADNKIATFGREAGATEREAASKILSRNLEARAAGRWSVQCMTLTRSLAKEIEEGNPAPGRPSCARSLQALAAPLATTRKVRADTLDGAIAALRVKGKRGYALYHGDDGKNYAMPMKKVGGQWKVSFLQTTKLP